jgi:hypothetical protein
MSRSSTPKGLGDPARLPSDGFVVDVREYPLVIITHCGTISDQALEEYLVCMRAMPSGASAPPRSAIIYRMMPGSRPLNAKQRKRQAEWLIADERSNAGFQGIAFVFDSALARGALQAVFWVAPPKHDYVIVSTMEEALGWARTRLTAGALSRVPESERRS